MFPRQHRLNHNRPAQSIDRRDVAATFTRLVRNASELVNHDDGGDGVRAANKNPYCIMC